MPARLLDTTERIIGYKIQKLGIDAGRFRPDASASPKAAAGVP